MLIDRVRLLDHSFRFVASFLCARLLVGSLAVLGVSAGCSAKPTNLGQVEGIVRLNGKPLTAGKVRFLPESGRGAIGTIQPDGTFTLGTFADADGALVGHHQVAIIAYEPGKVGRPDPAVRGSTLKPLVPERYLATGTSNLTFDVQAGPNHAEFDLTSP